jgi:hypothetical protein
VGLNNAKPSIGEMQYHQRTMNTEEKAEMERLCRLIEVEQDQKKFLELVEKLNDLVGRRESRFTDEPRDQAS